MERDKGSQKGELLESLQKQYLLGGFGAALDANSHEWDPGAAVFKGSLRGLVAVDPSKPQTPL